MDPFDIIEKYYVPGSFAYRVLVQHSVLVASKALSLAERWNVSHDEKESIDIEFIVEAALLHDIGIYAVHAPNFGCFGEYQYLMHVVEGYNILMEVGLEKHARVALTHTGVGITPEDIHTQGLALPLTYDYLPKTIEEKMISYADLFYGKKKANLLRQKSHEEIEKEQRKISSNKIDIFYERKHLFE